MAHALRTLIAFAVVVITLPACSASSDSDEGPTFGAAEMQAVVVGTWNGTLTVGGNTAAMTLVLEHAAPGKSPSCSNRTLGVDPECVDMTSMGVKGTLTTADGAYTASPLTGTFQVIGLELSGGYLDLKLNDGKRISAQQKDKGFSGCTLYDDQGEAGSCTMAK